jgi:predicted nucleic acid-binding protein
VSGTNEDATLRRWLRAQATLGISSIAWTEFLCGPVDSRAHELATGLFNEIVPYEPPHAVLAAKLFNTSGRRRGTMMDCMVAAVAIAADASLASSNVADFRRLEPLGLTLQRD